MSIVQSKSRIALAKLQMLYATTLRTQPTQKEKPNHGLANEKDEVADYACWLRLTFALRNGVVPEGRVVAVEREGGEEGGEGEPLLARRHHDRPVDDEIRAQRHVINRRQRRTEYDCSKNGTQKWTSRKCQTYMYDGGNNHN